jgi:outer membrane immunogenic protein
MRGKHRFGIAVAVAGAVALYAGSAAADGPRPYLIGATDLQGEPDWTGFYVGGKLGGAWGDVSPTFQNSTTALTPSLTPSGVAGGVIAGGNLQTGHWVFGIEGSFQGIGFSQSAAGVSGPGSTTEFSTESNWLGTVEGRIGYAFNRYLVFGKGGWAGSNVNVQLERTGANAVTAVSDKFVDGWTIGGGLEYQLWGNFVIGMEYDYVTLNLSTTSDCPLCIAGIPDFSGAPGISGDGTMNQVMVRASYLFRPED